jgi:hypothetical protein
MAHHSGDHQRCRLRPTDIVFPSLHSRVTDMSDVAPKTSTDAPADTPPAEPTQAEIDEWAAQERARREAWLRGPTEEERAAYAKRLRHRRLAETFDESEHRLEESMRRGLHYGREGQLAAEGAMTLFYRWSRHMFAELVRAGREWEEETALPTRRRRVPFDDEPD